MARKVFLEKLSDQELEDYEQLILQERVAILSEKALRRAYHEGRAKHYGWSAEPIEGQLELEDESH